MLKGYRKKIFWVNDNKIKKKPRIMGVLKLNKYYKNWKVILLMLSKKHHY